VARAMQSPITLCLFTAFLLGHAGCVSNSPQALHSANQDLQRERRSGLGFIGVMATRSLPETKFQMPSKDWKGGARKGAKEAFEKALNRPYKERLPKCEDEKEWGDWIGCIIFSPIYAGASFLLEMIAGPVVGGAGGAVGAAATKHSSIVAEADASLMAALADMKVQESLADHVVQIASAQMPTTFIRLADHISSNFNENDNSFLSRHDIDTILQTNVETVELRGDLDEVDPPLKLFLTVHVNIVRRADRALLDERKYNWEGGGFTFTEWGTQHATPFRNAIANSYQTLAEQIVLDLVAARRLRLEGE